MLSTPEFDAYNCIERFAKDPNSLANIQAWLWLKRTTGRMYWWRSLLSVGIDAAELYANAGMGCAPGGEDSGKQLTAQTLMQMSDEERDDLYISICKQAGVVITKEMLASRREQDRQDT